MAKLKPLKLKMTVDTSGVADALADAYDSAGRKLTAVDALINETIAGDARLGAKAAYADAAKAAAWEAVARDLARQVINAETEIAELDEAGEFGESWLEVASESADLDVRLQEEEQAHCDTYVEAVRLSAEFAAANKANGSLAAELAGWQNSSHAEYRRSTAARRLEAYCKTDHT